MNILYLHQYFVPPGGAGGTRSYEFARRLVARGHQVTLVTSSAHMRGAARHEHLDGIHLVVLPVAYDNRMSPTQRIRAFVEFAARAAAESARHRADVVFATSTPLTIALPGLAARALTRAPMVFEVRDLWPQLPIALGALRSPWTKAAARGLEWVAYHGAREVVALSPGMADGVVRAGIPRNKVTVIPNSSDIDGFTVDPALARAFARRLFPDLAEGQPLVAYAGCLGRSHDAGWLVEVAAKMRDIDPGVRFALVGKGGMADAIEQRARRLGVLGNNLWMPGPLAKRDVPLLLGAATVTTSTVLPVPELLHNSANKFFDGLAAGRPIALNYGGWQADLVREYDAGLVLPQADVGRSAKMLADLVRNDRRVDAMGAAARALARERFDRDLLTDKLEEVLIRAAA